MKFTVARESKPADIKGSFVPIEVPIIFYTTDQTIALALSLSIDGAYLTVSKFGPVVKLAF